MIGYRIAKWQGEEKSLTPFEKLYDLFMELLVHTSGDVDEAIDWLRELDKAHKLTTPDYTIDDFLEDLKKKNIIAPQGNGGMGITPKAEQLIRQRSFEQIFGKMKKGPKGAHHTKFTGNGDEPTSGKRNFVFGDTLENIAFTDSIKNAHINHGIENFMLTENDVEIAEKEFKTGSSTVLMIDISHSMILYGEDRITPAKKVAMALSEFIKQRYPKDTLDIIVFGNDAWEISVKDLPYLQVGPYHTNTAAGLELAMDILRRKKTANKQIFMITDGKPSCLKENGEYYQNSFGLDPKIVNRCLNLAAQARKSKIPITTFMIARDAYLQQFVEEFTAANQGKAFYTSLKGLGDYMFHDYQTNRKRQSR